MAYVGLDRGIVDHWIYQDAEYFKVWFEILLRARFSKEPEKKMQDGKFFTIEYGQFMFGRVSWSERLGVSEQRLRTLLKKLINDNMIELISTYPKFSIYSVKNYAKFNQQPNHQQSHTEQEFDADANHQINSVSTINQPAANQQLTTQEESNKVNKVKNDNKKITNYSDDFENFWTLYPNKVGKKDAWTVWQRLLKDKKEPQVIIECAMNYASSCKANKTELKFIKHPKTFLNEERYLDYKSPVIIYNGGEKDGRIETRDTGNAGPPKPGSLTARFAHGG